MKTLNVKSKISKSCYDHILKTMLVLVIANLKLSLFGSLDVICHHQFVIETYVQHILFALLLILRSLLSSSSWITIILFRASIHFLVLVLSSKENVFSFGLPMLINKCLTHIGLIELSNLLYNYFNLNIMQIFNIKNSKGVY